jgi:hypothetical protein
MKYAVAFIALLFVAGCASNVLTQFPGAGDGGTGTLIIKFADPMQNVHVTLDGKMVAEDKFTERVEIRDIPALLPHELSIVANSRSRAEVVDMQHRFKINAGEERVLLVATPPRSTGYWVYEGLTWIAVMGWIIYLATQQD